MNDVYITFLHIKGVAHGTCQCNPWGILEWNTPFCKWGKISQLGTIPQLLGGSWRKSRLCFNGTACQECEHVDRKRNINDVHHTCLRFFALPHLSAQRCTRHLRRKLLPQATIILDMDEQLKGRMKKLRHMLHKIPQDAMQCHEGGQVPEHKQSAEPVDGWRSKWRRNKRRYEPRSSENRPAKCTMHRACRFLLPV